MTKPPDDTRIMINAGYSSKFILPTGTSADVMAVLVNAIPIDDTYHKGKNITHRSTTEDKRISVEIISADEITDFLDARDEDAHQEYDIIVSEVKDKLEGKKHAVVLFRSNQIKVGRTEIEYEDLANPEIDPEAIINAIVVEALKDPGREL